MTPRYAKAQPRRAGPAVEHSQADQALIDSGFTKISGATQTAREPAWPAGDVQMVSDGQLHRGSVEKIGGGYVARDGAGALVGYFLSRQEAFSALIFAARAREKGGAT